MRRLASLTLAFTVLWGCDKPTSGTDSIAVPDQASSVFPDPARLIDDRARAASPPEGSDSAAKLPPDILVKAQALGPSNAPTALRFTFDRPMRKPDALESGDPLEGLSLNVTPKIETVARWTRPDTLVVTPSAPWPNATAFSIELASATTSTGSLKTPVALSFVSNPLAMWARAGTLMYPETLGTSPVIVMAWNQAVPLPDKRLVEIVEASSKAELVAGRFAPADFELKAGPNEQAFVIELSQAPKTDHWYRLTISKDLKALGPQPLGADFVSYLRGPEPFAMTDVSCGWPSCTTEDQWTISFNSEPDEASLAGCFTVKPALDLGTPKLQGWSVALAPVGAKADTTYTLTVTTRCRDTLGQRLPTAVSRELKVTPPRARLSMVSGTGYLAPAGDVPPAVEASAHHSGPLSVSMRRITREELGPFLAKHLEDWGDVNLDDAETQAERMVEPDADGSNAISLADGLVGNRGLVLLKVKTSANGDNDGPVQRSALVQVTELGLIVKSGPQDTLVWVTSLIDQRPLSGVTVQATKKSGEVVWTATTDERGVATGPGTSIDSEQTEAGRIVVATLGDDVAFIDLQRWQNRSDPYDFGLPYVWNPKSDVIRGQVFTERGVYRTGEKVHIKGFVRLDRGRALEPVPTRNMNVRVIDPLGNRALAREVTLGEFGDFDLELALDGAAPLGGWRIEAEAAAITASTNAPASINGSVTGAFRVEAYRATTFEVTVDGMQLENDTLKAEATARYFSGASMPDSDIRWWITASAAGFSPSGYDDFIFESQDRDDYWWRPSEVSVAVSASGNGKLDASGRMVISAELGDTLKKSLESGPKNLLLESEVTDVDQQTVAGRSTLRIESSDVYVGVKPSARFAGVGDKLSVEVVALTPEGKLTKPASATLRWSKREWVYELRAAAGGGESWVSEYKDELISERRLDTFDNGRTSVDLSVPSSGSFLLEVEATDTRGRKVVTRTQVWAWGGGASWSENDAGKLTLIAERETWRVGETAKMIVQSPFDTARALVTVERSGVIERRVFDVTGSAPLIELPVTADMVPNAYVSVVLIGIPKSGEASGRKLAEARMGYLGLDIDTTDRRITVGVAPKQPSHRPGERATVELTLRDVNGKPVAGQVTFMAVDEGVLALTGYRTPDPHAAMFAERPLSVTTSDARRSLWERLVPEDGMKSDWGGGGEGGEPENYRSAFATTAAFMPNVQVPESGSTEVSFDLPDNLTRFRLMAVAATKDGRFGRGESQLEVNKPLMIRPALPRFLSVGDVVEARAVVTMLGEPKDQGAVEVELAVSGPVELDGATTTSLTPSGKPMPVAFRVRAKNPGEARFRFTVRSKNGETDAFEVPVTVQWPAAERRLTTTGSMASAQTSEAVRLEIPDWLHKSVGGLTVTVATSRLNDLLPSLEYLLEYPYGCVEQTTGATLPLLALRVLQEGLELPGITRAQVLERAQAGLDRLRTMQTWSGGLSYWPGEPNPHPWGSAYAGLALVTARKIGDLSVPETTIDKLTTYLRDILKGEAAAGLEEWRNELATVKPLAAWVLALAGAPEPSFHAQLFSDRASLPDFSRLLLALAIDEAKGDKAMVQTLIDEVTAKVTADDAEARVKRAEKSYYWSTMDSDLRTNALLVMVLEKTRPNDPLLPKLVAAMMADRREGHWGNTQDNAFAILALARHFVRTESATASTNVKVLLDGEPLADMRFEGGNFTPRSVTIPMSKAVLAQGKTLAIVRDSTDGPLYWSMRLDYAPNEVPRIAIDNGLRLDRRYVIAAGPRAGQPATEVDAGELIKVELMLEADSDQRYVAVDDPLPAGLEPVMLSFATTGSDASGLADGNPSYDGWRPQVFGHTEQRDDRVHLFADWLPSGTHNHTYLVRATTKGSFTAPAARAHAMYSPEVYGQSSALDVKVL